MIEFEGNPEFEPAQLGLAGKLEAEAAAALNIYDYYNDLLAQYVEHPFIGDGLQQIATWVEPVDRAIGNDAQVPGAQAFYMGVIFGVRVADLMGGQRLLDTLDKAPLPMPDSDGLSDTDEADGFERLHAQAALIMEKGAQVYARKAAFHPLLERWEDLLVADATKHVFFRRGFAIVLHLADGAQGILETEQTLEKLGSYNWDEEFAKLELEP